MPKAHLHLGRAFAAALILVPALFLARPTAAQGLPRPTLRFEGGLAAEAAFDDPPVGELAGGEAGVATSTAAVAFTLPVVLGGGRCCSRKRMARTASRPARPAAIAPIPPPAGGRWR
jgi:hypothetical protein